MPSVPIASIPDIINGTLAHFDRLKFNMIASDLQSYPGLRALLDNGGIVERKGVAGHSFQFHLMLRRSDQVRHTSPIAENVTVTAPALLTIGTERWGYIHVPWTYTTYDEFVQDGPERIVDEVQMRRVDALVSLMEALEGDVLWGLTPQTDSERIFGIQNLVTATGATATAGHNGTVPTGYTTVHGVNPTTQTMNRWNNYNGAYTTAGSRTDLIRMIRDAERDTNFGDVPMVTVNDHGERRTSRFMKYAGKEVLRAFEEFLENTNQNLILDLMPAFDKVTSNRMSFQYVPALNNSRQANNPVYLLDWRYIHLGVLKGDYFRENGPHRQSTNPDAFVTRLTLTANLFCSDRRRQSVFVQA